jgi:predicted nucleotidyltransferase
MGLKRVLKILSRNLYTVEQIADILQPVFDSYHIKRAVLFGSYVKGSATVSSDVDLYVDSGLRGLSFLDLADDVQAVLNKDVDIFDVRHIDKNSRIEDEIVNTGVLIYEK